MNQATRAGEKPFTKPKKNKKELRERNHIAKNEGAIELLIVNYYLTPEHVLKEKYKIEEKYGGWSSKNIFELLKFN